MELCSNCDVLYLPRGLRNRHSSADAFVTWLAAVIDEEMTAASGKASKVHALLEDGASLDPRRNQHRSRSQTQPSEVKLAALGFAVGGEATRRAVRGNPLVRRNDVVIYRAGLRRGKCFPG